MYGWRQEKWLYGAQGYSTASSRVSRLVKLHLYHNSFLPEVGSRVNYESARSRFLIGIVFAQTYGSQPFAFRARSFSHVRLCIQIQYQKSRHDSPVVRPRLCTPPSSSPAIVFSMPSFLSPCLDTSSTPFACCCHARQISIYLGARFDLDRCVFRSLPLTACPGVTMQALCTTSISCRVNHIPDASRRGVHSSAIAAHCYTYANSQNRKCALRRHTLRSHLMTTLIRSPRNALITTCLTSATPQGSIA
jgi:hypothetical protein